MRLRIDLAYNGTNFHGWAKQPQLRTVQGEIEAALYKVLRLNKAEMSCSASVATDPSTMQPSAITGRLKTDCAVDGVLQANRQPLFFQEQQTVRLSDSSQAMLPCEMQSQIQLTVAGRTDAGVHAAHQVCHLDVDEKVIEDCKGHMNVSGPQALCIRLQRILPPDIAIHSITVAPEGFDARFSALDRTYVYRICERTHLVDPRLRDCVLVVDRELDVAAMNKAADFIVGLHDFGSFATPNPGGTTIRQVKSAHWYVIPQAPLIPVLNSGDEEPRSLSSSSSSLQTHPESAAVEERSSQTYRVPSLESGLLCFQIVADAFAHNMVRSLVQGCVNVGMHKRTVDWFANKIAQPLREGSTGPMSPRGLTLEYVQYPPETDLAARAEAIRAKRTL